MLSILCLPFRWARTARLPGFAALLATFLVTALAACGGGVDSGGTGTYASGPITGYGSIVVGGVHYDESAALVLDDAGTPRSAADLKLGMVTEIQASAPMGSASMPTATAMAVRFRSELVGTVGMVDAASGTLTVLGQTVKVGATTVFDAALVGGLAALHVGDVIEVYGQFDALSRRYVASRIEPRPNATQYKLRGLVTALDPVAHTLVIGGQTLGYAGVSPLPGLAIGQILRVLFNPLPVGGHWVATAIEVGTRHVPDRDHAKVEGRITAFSSSASFEVDGIPVRTDSSTRFPDGTSGIVLGAQVEVGGRTRNGWLEASTVALDDDATVGTERFELSGSIQSLDTLAQTFVVRGFTVHWSATTRFETGTSASSLRNNRKVEVKGALSADGTRLEASFVHVEL
jgi:Domain of unknown function (DUF5666)